MVIRVLSEMTPPEVRETIGGFSRVYVNDWDWRCRTDAGDRAAVFGAVLRKWQAARPRPMRRPEAEASHPPPYLEDLIDQAVPHLDVLSEFTLEAAHEIGPVGRAAFNGLWHVFTNLTWRGEASCVGISKAVMLLSDGRIGPAFDSNVRARLGSGWIESADEWVQALRAVGEDVRGFQQVNGIALREAVPPEFAHVGTGRLCDMIFGPRA